MFTQIYISYLKNNVSTNCWGIEQRESPWPASQKQAPSYPVTICHSHSTTFSLLLPSLKYYIAASINSRHAFMPSTHVFVYHRACLDWENTNVLLLNVCAFAKGQVRDKMRKMEIEKKTFFFHHLVSALFPLGLVVILVDNRLWSIQIVLSCNLCFSLLWLTIMGWRQTENDI